MAADAADAPGLSATGTVLDRIAAARRRRLDAERAARPRAVLERLAADAPSPIGFAARLREGRAGAPPGARLRLIAEIKRASPSRGVIDADLDAAAQALAYRDAGAAAVSVLTEPDFFRGGIGDLDAAVRVLAGDPDRPALLRKEFVIDPWQVVESRAHGADALLLIAMLLAPGALAELIALTRELGMEALVEVHDAAELDAALAAGAVTIGVNNRVLRTFGEDLATFERLAPLALGAAPGVTLVAESAVAGAADAARLAAAGAHALLAGEALVRSGDVAAKARELMLADGAAPEAAP